MLKFLLSPDLEFKSLIIVIVGFQNFVCCLAWAVDLEVQITDERRCLYIEIEIVKAASSKYLLNDVVAGQSDRIYKLLPSSVILNPR